MANGAVKVRVLAGPCKAAMKRYVARCEVVVRGAGGDKWDTGNGSEHRDFEVELRGKQKEEEKSE